MSTYFSTSIYSPEEDEFRLTSALRYAKLSCQCPLPSNLALKVGQHCPELRHLGLAFPDIRMLRAVEGVLDFFSNLTSLSLLWYPTAHGLMELPGLLVRSPNLRQLCLYPEDDWIMMTFSDICKGYDTALSTALGRHHQPRDRPKRLQLQTLVLGQQGMYYKNLPPPEQEHWPSIWSLMTDLAHLETLHVFTAQHHFPIELLTPDMVPRLHTLRLGIRLWGAPEGPSLVGRWLRGLSGSDPDFVRRLDIDTDYDDCLESRGSPGGALLLHTCRVRHYFPSALEHEQCIICAPEFPSLWS